MTEYPTGTQLFAASPGDDVAIEAAREYIKNNGYTAETVKLVKSEGMVLVIKK